MGWSVTGQLLCNVPPSIIESFFTMILITGHNIGDAKRRVDLFNLYLRRLKLISYLDTVAKLDGFDVVEQVCETEEIKEANDDIKMPIKVGAVEDVYVPEEIQKIPVDLDALA
jgi:predicted nucleotidyltransferase